MQITVDNTFDVVGYDVQTPSDHHNVYDRKAFAPEEVAQVKALTVSPTAWDRIDKACSAYFADK